MADPPFVDLGAFDRVDASGVAGDYVRWMAHQRRGGADDPLIDALDLPTGGRVLDLGCGPGVDLAGLAARVGPTGTAVGLDRSAAMAVASRGATRAPTMVSDGQALPFPAGAFDGAWARAVLIHTREPARAVAELARVVRPGGRIALSEPDHGSHLVATDEIEIFERVRAHRRTTFRHPLVGRDLPALAVAAGLEVEARRIVPIEHRTLAAARAAGGPLDVAVRRAVEAGVITAAEGDRYLASLEERDAAGAFLFAALAVVVLARRPTATGGDDR